MNNIYNKYHSYGGKKAIPLSVILFSARYKSKYSGPNLIILI